MSDQLEANKEALRCLEAVATSTASDQDHLRQQLVEGASASAKLEAALSRSEAALNRSEEAVATTTAR